MGLAILNVQQHERAWRQGALRDAYVKSKYDNGMLIISAC